MKKILVILTGGTIGSRVEGEEMNVTGDSPVRLLAMYKEIYGNEHEFEVLQPFSILSENMGLSFWSQLCRTLWDIDYEAYEGIILAHGSDTISYTSALLGLLFAHVPLPLILTASNYPLGEKKSNGLRNFRSAVELIDTHMVKGVFCVYQNHKGENNVYLATRLMEADPYLDQFESFGGIPLGKMEKGDFRYFVHPVNPTLSQLNEKRTAIAGKCPVFEKPVLLIRAYPGLDYRTIDLSVKPAAVLHYLYHSATACIQGKDTSVLRFMDCCQERNIDFYAASAKQSGGKKYATAKEMLRRGAVVLENISREAAYAKLLLLYNLPTENNVEKVKETIYFENLPFQEES